MDSPKFKNYAIVYSTIERVLVYPNAWPIQRVNKKSVTIRYLKSAVFALLSATFKPSRIVYISDRQPLYYQKIEIAMTEYIMNKLSLQTKIFLYQQLKAVDLSKY